MQESRGQSPEGERPLVSLLSLFRQLPPSLLQEALTHPHAVDDRTRSYERLEFLGDSVLGLIVASRLYRLFPRATEGQLARIKAYVVSRTSCTAVAQEIGLGSFIMEASPIDEEHKLEMASNPTLLGNVLEALIGACFLAFGFATLEEAVGQVFAGRIQYAIGHIVDHKTVLQEVLARTGRKPVYRVIKVEGPAHQRVFTAVCEIDGVEFGRGVGGSIKESEQIAARLALKSLGVSAESEDGEWLSSEG